MALDKGVDVSFFQDKNETLNIQMNFFKAKEAGAKFAYIKSSQATYADPDFQMNRRNVKEAGLYYGFYHFLTWNISGKVQAQYYWNLIKDDRGQLPMVVDFETNPGVQTVPNAKFILKDFLEELKRLSNNQPLIIYSGNFFWKENNDKDPYWKQYGFWVASYSDQTYMETNLHNFTPFDDWILWQFTDRLPGLNYGAESLQIDGDYLNGDINAFINELHPPTNEELVEKVKLLEARLVNEVAERQALYKLIDSAVALLGTYKN